MNYKPFVGFGFYGAVNSTQRANFYSSWGLMVDLPSATIKRGISILQGLWTILGG